MTQTELYAKLDKFLADNLGKQVIVLPSSQAQGYNECFDEAVAFTNLLGVPHYQGNPSPFPYNNAHEIYDKFGPFQATYFERIANTDTFIPQKGDICIFAGGINGGFGHVCLSTGVGDTNTFQSIDTNWSPRQSVTKITHNYNYFLGVLRFKVTNSGTTPQPPMNDPRAGYFDLIWHARYGQQVDTPKVTQAQIDNHIAWTRQEQSRAGVLDQVRDIAWKGESLPDSNKLTADQIVAKIKGAPSDLKQKILDLLANY